MPIASRKPDAEIPVIPNLPQTHKETYQGIVADQNNTPVNALVAYLEGSPWTVDYYGQLKGLHNDLRELDPGQKAAFQQYQKTIGLELRVSSALGTSYDAENAFTGVTGTAIITYIIPNVEDYFIADAGSRQQGLYRITNVDRKVFNRDSVYEINYTLVAFVTTDSPLYQDIETKVVREYQFSKNRLIEGISPIMTRELYVESVELGIAYSALLKQYFRDLFNRSYMTLVVPGQDRTIYDSRLVDFWYQLMDTQDVPELKEQRHVSMDHDRYIGQGSLWSILLDRNYSGLQLTCQKACLVPRVYFNHSSWLKGPAFWRFDFYVYPKDVNTEAKLPGDPEHTEFATDRIVPSSLVIKNNAYVNGTETIPLIKPVAVDDYYVLSQAFYDSTSDLSVLEILTRDYLKVQTLDLPMLSALMLAYPTWPVLERFYYGPLLALLTKEAIKGFY